LSPELFEADDDGFPVQRGQDVDVPADLEGAARRAIDNCPEGAISIVE
jgi:ferredoxin